MASAEELARDFWRALCRRDVDRAGALLAENTRLHLAGMPPASGAAALETLRVDSGSESSLQTVARYRNMVITERIGRIPGERSVRRHHILSVACVDAGRITSWQDLVYPLGAVSALRATPRAEAQNLTPAPARTVRRGRRARSAS